jgi:hypothetical protein
MTPFTRGTATAALIVAIACFIAACSSTKEAPALDAERASEQMQSFVRDTMDTARGQWTSTSNGPAADPCTTPEGDEGVWFSWDQDADGVSDLEAVMLRVDRAWRDQGLPTTTQSVKRADGETLHRVGSSGHDVDSIQFNATSGGMSINVRSLCGAGNVNDFINEGG